MSRILNISDSIMSPNDYITMAISSETGRPVFIDKDGGISDHAIDGVQVMMNCQKPHDEVYVRFEEASPVNRLPFVATAPVPRIASLACGDIEEFFHQIGFCLEDSSPKESTAALYFTLKNNALYTVEYLIGGQELDIRFKMSTFLGRDGKEVGGSETEVHAKQKISDIRFRRNSHVTNWSPIHEYFASSLSSPGAAINWTEGAPIYVRWKLVANRTSNEPGADGRLQLEGMVLEEGQTMETLPSVLKEELRRGRATTFLLWEQQVEWLNPDKTLNWQTTPGIRVLDAR